MPARNSQPDLFTPAVHKPFGKSTRRKSMPRAKVPGAIVIAPDTPVEIQLRQIENALANAYWAASKTQQKKIGETIYIAREFVRNSQDALDQHGA